MRIVVMVIATIALMLFALSEVGTAFPVAGWLYLSISVIFAAAIVRRRPLRKQLLPFLMLLLFCGAVAALYFIDWYPRKPFLRDLYSVHAGMSVAQVKQIMGRYTEGTGWPAIYGATSNSTANLGDLGSGKNFSAGASPSGELTLNDSIVFRHSTSGDFDSDWGIVTFSNGVVANVSFSPD